MNAPDGKRITIKMPQDLVDRITHAQNLTTEQSLAAFVRALVDQGLTVFRHQMSKSFLPNDSFENRGKQVPRPAWPASAIMKEIAGLVDAQHHFPNPDAKDGAERENEELLAVEAAQTALDLGDLIRHCEEHGPDKVKKWLDGKARANPSYQQKLEIEMENWAAMQEPRPGPDEDLDDPYSRETLMSNTGAEIAKL